MPFTENTGMYYVVDQINLDENNIKLRLLEIASTCSGSEKGMLDTYDKLLKLFIF